MAQSSVEDVVNALRDSLVAGTNISDDGEFEDWDGGKKAELYQAIFEEVLVDCGGPVEKLYQPTLKFKHEITGKDDDKPKNDDGTLDIYIEGADFYDATATTGGANDASNWTFTSDDSSTLATVEVKYDSDTGRYYAELDLTTADLSTGDEITVTADADALHWRWGSHTASFTVVAD